MGTSYDGFEVGGEYGEFDSNCSCMMVKFDRQTVAGELIPYEIDPGETITLTITGNLKEEFGSTPFTGEDSVRILGVKVKPENNAVRHREKVRFKATVTGNDDGVGYVYFGTKLTLPNGRMYPRSGFLFGPVRLSLDAYESKSGSLSQFIPSNAPLGTYIYHGYVGRPGVGILFQDQFEFEVTGE